MTKDKGEKTFARYEAELALLLDDLVLLAERSRPPTGELHMFRSEALMGCTEIIKVEITKLLDGSLRGTSATAWSDGYYYGEEKRSDLSTLARDLACALKRETLRSGSDDTHTTDTLKRAEKELYLMVEFEDIEKLEVK